MKNKKKRRSMERKKNMRERRKGNEKVEKEENGQTELRLKKNEEE